MERKGKMSKWKTKTRKPLSRLAAIGLSMAVFAGNLSGLTVQANSMNQEGQIESVTVEADLLQNGYVTEIGGNSKLIISEEGYQLGENGTIVEEKDIHIAGNNMGKYSNCCHEIIINGVPEGGSIHLGDISYWWEEIDPGNREEPYQVQHGPYIVVNTDCTIKYQLAW